MFLDFILHLISSFVYGGSLTSTVMTLFLTKFEKILNSVSFSTFTCSSTFALEKNLFQSIMFKSIIFNLHFCNPKQPFGKVGDTLFGG